MLLQFNCNRTHIGAIYELPLQDVAGKKCRDTIYGVSTEAGVNMLQIPPYQRG